MGIGRWEGRIHFLHLEAHCKAPVLMATHTGGCWSADSPCLCRAEAGPTALPAPTGSSASAFSNFCTLACLALEKRALTGARVKHEKDMTGKAKSTWLIILNIIPSDRLKVNPSVLHVVSGSWVPWEADSETEFRSSLCALGYICGRKREEAG